MIRPEQDEIGLKGKGVERPKIPEIDKAARAYVNLRDEWSALGKKLTEKKKKLIEAVHDNVDKLGKPDEDGKRFYTFDDLEVIHTTKEGVKVKGAEEDEEEL